MIRERLERLAGRVEVDWSGFAVTRGCFVVGGFPVELADERAEKRDVVVSSGFRVPEVMRPRWEPWARWYHLPRLCDLLPKVSAPRGPITYPRSIP